MMEKTNREKDENFFLENEVEFCSYKPIKIIFDTLLLKKKWKQQELADHVQVDKALISKIVHGLHIPSLNLRLKISEALNVDSSVIWRYHDLPYIKKLINKQRKTPEKKMDEFILKMREEDEKERRKDSN